GQSHSCQRSEGDCHYGHGASSGAETLCGSLRVYRGPAGRTRVSTLFVLTVRQPVAGWWGYPQGCELKHPGSLCSAAGEVAKLVTTSAGDCDFPPELRWQSIRLLIEGPLVRALP